MGQQMAHRDVTLHRDRVKGVRIAVPNLHLREVRQELSDRIVELKISIFVTDHRRHGGNRLGHGIKSENRILGHRLSGFDVHLASAVEKGAFAAPVNHSRKPGQAVRANLLLHP